jgi:hypothetical protein
VAGVTPLESLRQRENEVLLLQSWYIYAELRASIYKRNLILFLESSLWVTLAHEDVDSAL